MPGLGRVPGGLPLGDPDKMLQVRKLGRFMGAGG
jgi:hypothetical protein